MAVVNVLLVGQLACFVCLQTAGQVQEMLAGSANSQQQVEAFLTEIYCALGSPAPIKDKVRAPHPIVLVPTGIFRAFHNCGQHA